MRTVSNGNFLEKSTLIVGWDYTHDKEKMSWFRNATANLYDAALATVAAAHNALSKRLRTLDVDRGVVGASVEADGP